MKNYIQVFKRFFPGLFTLMTMVSMNATLHASGGDFFEYEKIGPVISGSYHFMLPVGDKMDDGRGGHQYGRFGQGFELEAMYFWNVDYTDHFRLGFGYTMPFHFLPVNKEYINPLIDEAFTKEQYGNTDYIAPKHNQWIGYGFGLEGSAAYIANRFTLETTLKVGAMFMSAPNYRLTGGSYVPPEFVQYFPREGNTMRTSKTIYVNWGLQANYYFSEYVGFFVGAGYQYMDPKFNKDLVYVEDVSNQPTAVRRRIKTDQEFQFFMFRFGINVNVGDL